MLLVFAIMVYCFSVYIYRNTDRFTYHYAVLWFPVYLTLYFKMKLMFLVHSVLLLASIIILKKEIEKCF